MKSYKLPLLILSGIIFISGCDISFKRISPAAVDTQNQTNSENSETLVKDQPAQKTLKNKTSFGDTDSKLIARYYSDVSNETILQNIINQTHITKKQANKLVVAERIPHNTQVMPLPLELENLLSPLPQHVLRIQIGKYVILMDVKSRQIHDVIKF